MGGISTASLDRVENAFRFTGEISTENSGGFATGYLEFEWPDLSHFQGMEILIKGDGQRYGLNIRSDIGQSGVHRSFFQTNPEGWEWHRLVFSDFKAYHKGSLLKNDPGIALNKIEAIGLIQVEKKEGPFVILFREISFFHQ